MAFYGSSPTDFLDNVKKAEIVWIDHQTGKDFFGEANKIGADLGFSDHLISQLAKTKKDPSSYLDLDAELYFILPAVVLKGMEVDFDPVFVLIKKNFILTIHTSRIERFIRLRRYAEGFMKKIPLDILPADKLTLTLVRIIDENINRNFEKLHEIEEHGDRLNKWMMDPFTPVTKIGPEIYKMKHALMSYLSVLWATADVLNNLRYGDAELLTEDQKVLDKITCLCYDINGQVGIAEHLSEVLASGLEVLQTIYNNQLQAVNNRLALLMGYLTIIGTALLVPNTLATVFSGSVFDLRPKDIWWYAGLLIGSTVLATVLVYWYVKRRGWLK